MLNKTLFCSYVDTIEKQLKQNIFNMKIYTHFRKERNVTHLNFLQVRLD